MPKKNTNYSVDNENENNNEGWGGGEDTLTYGQMYDESFFEGRDYEYDPDW